MKVEVSLGEAIDKLNILELKMKKISNKEKCKEIQKEINELYEFKSYKSKYTFFYNLLTFVNETIWDTTDIIKKMDFNNHLFGKLSNKIFEFNQKRFRIKSWFNTLECSNIKEQKSYDLIKLYITANSINEINEKIAEINYLLLEYDNVFFINNDELLINTMKSIFKQPNLYYLNNNHETNINIIKLNDYIITENKEVYGSL
jgi:hypothetical protein